MMKWNIISYASHSNTAADLLSIIRAHAHAKAILPAYSINAHAASSRLT